jgi:3-phenylpropionate/cinnamic acid dioxygenase small subunit
MKEDFNSLQARVDRLETEYDWSENPPSRTRRFVTNVKVDDVSQEEIAIRSNLMLYRTRGDSTSYDILTGERKDKLRKSEGDLKIAERQIFLDQTVLDLETGRSLTVFL